MKLLVVRHLNGIKPAYDSDKEVFNKMPLNEVFEIEYTKRRNVKFHRKFFALLKLAYENQSDYRIMDDLQFNEVYNSVKETICKWIGVTNEMVEEQIEQYY